MNGTTNTIEVRVERMISAAPAEVYDAWLDPKTPGTPWNESARLILDARVDGLFNWVHGKTAHYGRFVELERGRRIQHTWMSPNTRGLDSVVTITFEKRDGGTWMSLVHTGLPDDEKGKSHEQGWSYFLDKLVASVTAGAKR